MLALTGCSGKIGGAVLRSIIEHKLHLPSDLVICTSSPTSHKQWDVLKSHGVQVRSFHHDEMPSMISALEGCTKFFIVSTPRIEMDFNDAPDGQGREKSHIAAIEAAKIAGVKHVYYSSLAFGNDSVAGVMRAHLRTEKWLKESGGGLQFTILREGLYNESWPLYFGYYDKKNDARTEVIVAGDGPICWTSIDDLGLATAIVITDSSRQYEMKTLYLSNPEAKTLKDVAEIVSRVKGTKIDLKVVSSLEHMRFYSEDMGRDGPAVQWWVGTYEALENGECLIEDETLVMLLERKGVKPKPLEETIKEMLD